jgi:hypothetical protein
VHDDRTRAARLLGFVEAGVAGGDVRVRWSVDDRERARLLASLREALEPDELAWLMSDGAGMSEDQAIDLARSI